MGEQVNTEQIASKDDLLAIFKEASDDAYNFADGYKKKFNVDIHEYIPDYSMEWFEKLMREV